MNKYRQNFYLFTWVNGRSCTLHFPKNYGTIIQATPPVKRKGFSETITQVVLLEKTIMSRVVQYKYSTINCSAKRMVELKSLSRQSFVIIQSNELGLTQLFGVDMSCVTTDNSFRTIYVLDIVYICVYIWYQCYSLQNFYIRFLEIFNFPLSFIFFKYEIFI